MTLRRPATAALLAALFAAPVARAADPSALWKIVDGRCVPDERMHAAPAPCETVDLAQGYAVLKDIRGREQYLLIPTRRLGGIESPELLQPQTPNYFAAAWQQAPLVEARVGHSLPRDDLSLAINSAYGRSQNQLHIHIDCISTAAHAILQSRSGTIGSRWTRLPPIAGVAYRAMFIAGETLGPHDPFRLLAASLHDTRREMGRHTLVLVGTSVPRPGFFLLDGELDRLRLDFASGEELQDHACRIAGTPLH
ncbi:CDP-diacylglycerol diphosphatase [Lichenicoccus sp.]|uniref:CDP-diacylglycerol diphosphatase n=1 Tax=Lichenicoccus sp. TaxID=2781899 RepID=UPI003D0F301B